MNIQLSHSQERSNVTGNIGAEDNMEILELQWPRILEKTCFVSTINCFVKSIFFYLPSAFFFGTRFRMCGFHKTLIYIYVCMYVCMHVCIYVYVCMYVCICFCFYFCQWGSLISLNLFIVWGQKCKFIEVYCSLSYQILHFWYCGICQLHRCYQPLHR